MEPVNFVAANVVFGANQPEYKPLPGEILTCWDLSPDELKRVQETGKIWLGVLTFGQPLQPVFVAVDKPEPYDAEE